MEPFVNIHTHHPQREELTLRCEGIHPWEAALWEGGEPPVSEAAEGVGEIGLDFARPINRVRQEALLRTQLHVAEVRRLPVVLHCVRAFEPLMRILPDYKLQFVVFHGFIGSIEQASRALAKGYFLSFGERSFRSPRTVEAMRHTPLERLFLESDESPTPIAEIYGRAAQLLGLDLTILRKALFQNYQKIKDQR